MHSKKRRISIIIGFLCGVIFLLNACSPRTAVTEDPNENNHVDRLEETVSITFQEGEPLKLVKKEAISIGELNGSVAIAAAFDDRYLLLEYTDDGMERFYECRPKENNCLTYIGEWKIGLMGSGDDILTNNNEYWFSFASEEGDALSLYKVDIQGRSVQVVRQDEAFPPFQYYHKIDENRLLFFGPAQLVSDEGEEYYAYYVDVYDIAQNERKNIIQITNLNQHISMPCIYYVDGLIYTLQSETYEGDTSELSGMPYTISGYLTSSYVRVYDIDGNLKQEIPLPDMTAFESQYNYFFNMYVFDDIIFISTLSRVMVAFEIFPDGTVQQLDLPQERSTFFFTPKGGEAEKAYMYNDTAGRLIVYDRNTRCFTNHSIEVARDTFYNPFLGEDGTLKLGLDQSDQKCYEIYQFEEYAEST